MKPEEVLDVLKRMRIAMATAKVDGIRVLEPLNVAIDALEKQVPKKPKKLSYEPLIRHGWEYECPECSKAIGINSVGFDFTDEDPFCPSCGQKINWEETP